MKFLVLSAMKIEDDVMADALISNGFEQLIDGIYRKGGIEVHTHIVGVGKVNAAANAITGILEVKPDYVVSQGCCAGVQNLNVGDVFFVDKSYQYDFNLEPIGYRKGEMPIFNDHVYGFESCLDKVCCSLTRGIMMTADKFCTSKDDFRGMYESTKVVGADMETASIAQVCYLTGDKFVGIRGVSDVIGSISQANDYAENERLACKNAAEAVVSWINCATCTIGC